MQILTADVMQELIDFRNKHDTEFDITIRNSNLYLRFFCGAMFEPKSLKEGIIEEKTFKEYFDIVQLTYILSKKLIHVVKETEI